jgi:hypothetical protein
MEGFACRSSLWLVALPICVSMLLAWPTGSGAFEVTKWEAGTCTASGCTASKPSEFYTQAAGHPPFGITDFRLKADGSGVPEGHIEEVRVDIPPGLSVDPLATPQCKLSELESAGGCPPDTQVGKVQLTAHVGLEILGLKPGITIEPPDPGSEATVYNMEPPPGHPLEAAFKVSIFETIVHIVGGIDTTGDYHEFFTIKEIPKNPELIESRLIFEGTALGPGGTLPFITMPSTCLGPQTSYVTVRSYEGQQDSRAFTTPVGASGCDKIPFKPTIKVTPANSQSDRPDGVSVKVEVPQNTDPESIDSSMLKDARVTLPEGMTLNPAAVNGLEACSDTQFGRHETHKVECPAGSQIGTTTIETPDLPPGSLTGGVYVGQPTSSDPQSGNEYRIFIDAEAPRYGVSVRLEGHVSANASTGRLTTAVLENPQVPFSDFIVNLSAAAHTPLANPLACGPATTNSSLTPYSGDPSAEPFTAFPVDFDGKAGACPSPLPFALSQSAATSPATGGANTSFAFGLSRGEGQQYLSKIATVLPAGLVGKIPSVTLCGEPQAEKGECTPASQIGTVAVTLGSGPTPLSLSGTAYLTTSYGGAPYGLSVVVPAEKIGPFNYGRIVTRAAISVDPHTARILVTSQLPTIVGGAPLRLRTLSVDVNRPNFTINPTNCGALTTDTTLTSTFGALQSLSSPFQAAGCGALAFAPKLTASTNAKTSKANGAIFVVKVAYPAGPQANIKSVLVALPKQLPSRISTLNKACPAATFEANPSACPPLSNVGTATVTTPVLPGKLTGPAVFVSHGGAAFPDLDLVLADRGSRRSPIGGDGVTVILVGNTNISKGITTSNYAAVPDVPVSSFEVRLPAGKDSVLGAVGSLCKKPLLMPTTITAQNGKLIKQSTKIAVGDCPITVLSHRVRGNRAIVTVKVPTAGRVRAGGKYLLRRSKRPGKAKDVTIVLPLSRAGLSARASHHHHRLAVKVRLGFVPKARKVPRSSASVTVVFR